MTEYIYQTWNGVGWESNSRQLFTYQNNAYVTEEIDQTWNGTSWANSIRYLFTYDLNYNLITEIAQTWSNSNWKSGIRGIFSYDSNNNLTQILSQYYSNSNVWEDSDRSTYFYDEFGNEIEAVYQYVADTVWVNNEKHISDYDLNNNLIEYTRQLGDNQAWVNSDKSLFSYDGSNNLVQELNQNWDGIEWKNINQLLHSYSLITEIEKVDFELNGIELSNNYPNPFNPSTKISYTIPTRRNVSLKVFNLLGCEVEELVKGEIEMGTYEINWSATNLPSGIYFYKLQAGTFIETKKMILLK